MRRAKVSEDVTMERSECSLSKNDRSRLRKRNLEDAGDEGLGKGRGGETEAKRVKNNNVVSNQIKRGKRDGAVYPWMLESRQKSKGI